jgi:hypothetical protein
MAQPDQHLKFLLELPALLSQQTLVLRDLSLRLFDLSLQSREF